MSDAFVYDAVRTPFGKFNGGLAGVRPDDLAAAVLTAVRDRTPGLDPADVEEVILGNANGAGEENRNVARMAALLAGFPVSVPGSTRQPPVRLLARRRDGGLADDRDRRRRHRAHRRRRVDDPRARGCCPSPAAASPPATSRPSRRRSAGGWSTRRCRRSGRSRSARPTSSSRRSTTCRRERQDAFAARSHHLADEAWNAGFYDDLVVDVPGADARARRVRARRLERRVARQAEAVLPQGRHHHRRQRLPAQRRRLRRPARLGEGGAGSLGSPVARIAGRAAHALEPQRFGYAPVEAAEKALARAGHRLVGRRRRRAQRGLRGAVAGLRGLLGHRPRDREHPRRRDRHRAPARRVRRPHPRHARQGAARGRPPLGRRGHLHRRGPGPRRGAGERRRGRR